MLEWHKNSELRPDKNLWLAINMFLVEISTRPLDTIGSILAEIIQIQSSIFYLLFDQDIFLRFNVRHGCGSKAASGTFFR